MKQKQSLEGDKRNAKPSIKKVGTMLGAGAMVVLSIGTMSVYALVGKTEISDIGTTTATEGKTTAIQSSGKAENYLAENNTSSATVSWWKAGVEDYDFALKAETTAEKATKAESETSKTTEITTEKETKTETSTEKKTTTTKKGSDIKSIDKNTMYVKQDVNMRKGPSKSKDVIQVLAKNAKVECNGKTDDGWYRVNYNGVEGYCMAEYLTDNAPATTTAAKKDEPNNNDSSDNAVISYTDDELEMMGYVLQSEVGNCSEASKIAVANVIINRVKTGRFGSSLSDVLTAPNQFTAISSYYNRTNPPSQNTMDCAKRALNGEGASESNGAIYYYAPKYCSSSSAAWFESLTFCMELEGQRFFKN